MNRIRHLAAATVAAALGALTIPALAQAGTSGPDATGPVSRAEVREDFRDAREAGALTPDGDVGDTRRTLMARDQYAEAKGEELRAEYERQAAADAAAQAAPPPAPVEPFGAQDMQNPTSPTGAQPQ